jgi:dihydroorotate dehydrogenase (NAD+) catalytic subunit
MTRTSKENLPSRVLAVSSVTETIFRLDCGWAGPEPRAGQFFMLKPEGSPVFLPRPVSLAGWSGKTGIKQLTFLIARRGAGTAELARLLSGETLELSGPLGNAWGDFLPSAESFGAETKNKGIDAGAKTLQKAAALVGGGIGIAPLLSLVQELSGKNTTKSGGFSFDFYAGFKRGFKNTAERDALFMTVTALPEYIIAAEEDGGELTGKIPDFLDPSRYAAVCACGPEPMLRAVAEKCNESGTPCYVSMERTMACGVGACLGCSVDTLRGRRRCCADGPVFPAGEIFFDGPPVSDVPFSPAGSVFFAGGSSPSRPGEASPPAPPPSRPGEGSPPDLSVTIGGVRLRNPVIAASGCFGYGSEYAGLLDCAALGGICTKGLTLNPRKGNSGERLHETPSGLLNSIGLENPGIAAFLEGELPRLRELGPAVIANLSGSDIPEYSEGAKLLDASSVDMIELNISCPNVKAGGMAFGLDPETAAAVSSAVRKAAPHKPLMVKLSPNAPDLAAVARACAGAGADALSLVNTFKAMAIDRIRGRPVFDNTSAGLSGPAVKPIALRMVWELWEALREDLRSGGGSSPALPLVGMGGIASAADALDFLMAGAAAVQVGSANFARPQIMIEIIRGIEKYMGERGIQKIGDLNIRKAPA